MKFYKFSKKIFHLQKFLFSVENLQDFIFNDKNIKLQIFTKILHCKSLKQSPQFTEKVGVPKFLKSMEMARFSTCS